MNKAVKSFAIITLLIPTIFQSCKKDNGVPSLTFITDAQYITDDTMVGLGDSVKVGLLAESNGVDLLKSLEITRNEQQVKAYTLDVETAQFTLSIQKSNDESEVWVFTLIDAEGHKAIQTITLTLDPNSGAGQILYYESTTLGAQANNTNAGFLSVSGGGLYNLGAAYGAQSEIDLLCYYDETDKMVIASPGANLDESIYQGSHNVTLWQTRNTSSFIKTTFTEAEFNQIVHDGPLVSVWVESQGKRKAKNLAVGDVYVFKIQSGKLGVFLVKSVNEGADGTVVFALKVQE